MKLSELHLYHRYPWAKPIVPEMPDPYFAQPKPWDFPQRVLILLDKMFSEIDAYFNNINSPIEVWFYDIYEAFGQLYVEHMTVHPTVTGIIDRYIKRCNRILV